MSPYWPLPPDCRTNLPCFFDRLGDRFFVRDLRLADVRFDFELAAQAIEDDLEMQFAHAGDDRLLRLFVGAHAERRIFLREARQRACRA